MRLLEVLQDKSTWTTPEFWLNMQIRFNLQTEEIALHSELALIPEIDISLIAVNFFQTIHYAILLAQKVNITATRRATLVGARICPPLRRRPRLGLWTAALRPHLRRLAVSNEIPKAAGPLLTALIILSQRIC